VEIHTALPVECPDLGWKGSAINGAHVYRVDGTVGDVFRIMSEAAARYGWLNAGAGREPYRVEGKKTMGIEIAEQLGWQTPDAIAPGIMVVKPFADFLILRALRATNGWAVGVPDDETLRVMAWVDRTEGLLLSPEGAAAIGAVQSMVREGQLGSRSRVVAFNT